MDVKEEFEHMYEKKKGQAYYTNRHSCFLLQGDRIRHDPRHLPGKRACDPGDERGGGPRTRPVRGGSLYRSGKPR